MADSSSSVKKQNSVIERVIIKNKYGEKLVGVLYETSSKEVIILCHGSADKKECPVNWNLTDALTKEGISVFCFDFSGNGESEGTFEYGNYNKEADDVHYVVMYFSGLQRVIGGILVHSKGGDSVLVYASRYHDVATVVNVCGRFKMERGTEDVLGKDYMERIKEKGFLDFEGDEGIQYRVTEESLSLSTDMHAICLSIATDCRVLTVHGSFDKCIPVEEAFEFAKVISNHKLHIIEGADHGYSNHQSELVKVVIEFIMERLRRPSLNFVQKAYVYAG
ncbi:hypothetical protein MKW98_016414 [Papaver atlanticum]|uniref:Serine aminopeptidase S33 domain-containing protein n=1 Tax=Papaver atlanticum TaxID=357466 RepID=A0AAD4T911_9MAGN|nr:hypothetical protein MKW98_016414 [Papaver atlanticum]